MVSAVKLVLLRPIGAGFHSSKLFKYKKLKIKFNYFEGTDSFDYLQTFYVFLWYLYGIYVMTNIFINGHNFVLVTFISEIIFLN